MDERLTQASSIIGYHFQDPGQLAEALESAGVHPGRPDGNKRLAQLGDALLKTILLDYWYGSGHQMVAGNDLVQRVGSNGSLTEAGRVSELDRCIYLNPSQRGGAAPNVIKATVTAVIAAVWIDSGRDWRPTEQAFRRLVLGAHHPETAVPAGMPQLLML
ncbi:MAG: hypothetical protein M1825_005613 [Sarcosagium campestre]|nr:MAG: hypothetical protein M1825_005613 [Sarcosagium campestre]